MKDFNIYNKNLNKKLINMINNNKKIKFNNMKIQIQKLMID